MARSMLVEDDMKKAVWSIHPGLLVTFYLSHSFGKKTLTENAHYYELFVILN